MERLRCSCFFGDADDKMITASLMIRSGWNAFEFHISIVVHWNGMCARNLAVDICGKSDMVKLPENRTFSFNSIHEHGGNEHTLTSVRR